MVGLDLQFVVEDITTTRSRGLPVQSDSAVSLRNHNRAHDSRNGCAVEDVLVRPRAVGPAL